MYSLWPPLCLAVCLQNSFSLYNRSYTVHGEGVHVFVRAVYVWRDVLWALRNQLQFALIFPFSHMGKKKKKRGEAFFNPRGHSPALQSTLVTWARHRAQGWCSGKWRQAGLVLKLSSIPTCISFQQQGSVTRLRRVSAFTFCHARWF